MEDLLVYVITNVFTKIFQKVTVEWVPNQHLISVLRFLVEFVSTASSTGCHSNNSKMSLIPDNAERHGHSFIFIATMTSNKIYGHNIMLLLFWTKYISVLLCVFVQRTVYLLSFHNVNRINIIYHNNLCVWCIHPNRCVVSIWFLRSNFTN